MQQSGFQKPRLMSDCIRHVECKCKLEVPYSVLYENGNNTNNTRGRYAAAYRLTASSHGVDALSVPPPLPDSPTPDLLRASSHPLPNGLKKICGGLLWLHCHREPLGHSHLLPNPRKVGCKNYPPAPPSQQHISVMSLPEL